MSRCHEFVAARPGLEHVRFLVCRPALSANGDIESAILNDMVERHRHPAGAPLSRIVAKVSARPGCEVVALIRNANLVLDEDLPRRILAAMDQLPPVDAWSIAASGGLGLEETRYLALYASGKPGIPTQTGPQPLLDPMPDITLLAAAHAHKVLGTASATLDTALETVLAAEGYLCGRVSLFAPRLMAGINGDLMSRDLNILRRELRAHFGLRLAGQSIPTLTGMIELDGRPDQDPIRTNLADSIQRVVSRHSTLPGISIVTRTRFSRPNLLKRLLTSISRARPDNSPLEVVLSSDASEETCNRMLDDLRTNFPHLDLRLQRNSGDAPSRVLNLVEGLKAARLEYVAIVDDDDYLDVFAFEHLESAFFLANRPLVFATSEVHEEVWEQIDSPSPVIARSTRVRNYPARRWSEMFDGVNKLPICAMIAPRDFVCRRLAQLDLTHDLSEDYALSLALLTAPDLPAITTLSSTFCHISLRGEENSVGMLDRRPWVRDISGHLGTLSQNPAIAPPGLWNLLEALTEGDRDPVTTAQLLDLQRALHASEREIQVLREEADHLRAALASRQEVPA